MAGHLFVSYLAQQQLGLAIDVCQSFAVDNGAFSAWKKGHPIQDWKPFYEWVANLKRYPNFDFAVIPDIIDGDEAANDRLLDEWPLGKFFGAPVWHMHESLDRFERLCRTWPRVCIGSSGDFAVVGNEKWWNRINQAMEVGTDQQGFPLCKLHGLRMLNPKIFTKLPFASADSTNIGRNIGMDKAWKSGAYPLPTKEARARVMRWRIEHFNGAQRWEQEF